MEVYREHYDDAHVINPVQLEKADDDSSYEEEVSLTDGDGNFKEKRISRRGSLDPAELSFISHSTRNSSADTLNASQERSYSNGNILNTSQDSIMSSESNKAPNKEHDDRDGFTAIAEDANNDARPPATCTVGSSAGTLSLDGTESKSSSDVGSHGQHADIVYAILDNLAAPDDFDSYILITPKQKRARGKKQEDTDGGQKRRASRRSRSNSNSAAGSILRAVAQRRATGFGSRRGSVHSRRSLASLSIDSGNGSHAPLEASTASGANDAVVREAQ